MKKFMWKAFIEKIGGLKKFIMFTIITIITTIAAIFIAINKGFDVVIETISISILTNYIIKYREAIKEINDKYTIEEKKK